MLLSCEAEEFANENGLGEAVFSGNPPRPTLANHVYGFDPLQSPPGRSQRTIPFRQSCLSLYRSMILFDDIVEVLALA